jgi:putative peptidoglycan lipid II flippase
VLRLMGPRVVGLAAAQVNFLVIIFFASFVSDQAISAMNYAFMMMMLPVGVIGMAIATAVFPTLAQQGAAADPGPLRTSISRALRLILYLAIPASAGLIVLATPAVRLLLERGAFDARSTDLVAGALVVYGLGIFAHSGVEILSRGFYALSDTRTPVAVAIVAMAMNVAFAALLVSPFGVRGLAGAASLAAILEFGLLLRLLDVRLGGLERRTLRRTVGGTVLGSVVMVQVMVITLLLLATAGIEGARWWVPVVQVAVAGGTGALAFLAISFRLNRDDVRMVTGRFTRRV